MSIESILAKNLKIEESEVTDDKKIVEDLGGDSLNTVEIVMELEREFDINLLTTTAAGKGHLNVSYPIKVLNNDVSPGFKNTLALKDLRLALEQGTLDGIDLSTGKSALKIYEKADKTEYKDLDWTSMFNYMKEINKID